MNPYPIYLEFGYGSSGVFDKSSVESVSRTPEGSRTHALGYDDAHPFGVLDINTDHL